MVDRPPRAWLAWGLWVATVVCAPVLWAPLVLTNGDDGWGTALIGGLLVPIMPTVSLVLTIRRSANPVGWLLAGAGFWFCFGLVTTQAATYGNRHGWSDEVLAMLLAGANVAFVGIILVPLAVMVFPDGSPPSARWRPLVVAGPVGACLVTVGGGLATSRLEGDGFTVANPLAADAVHGPAVAVAAVGGALMIVTTIGAVVAVVVRWRRGRIEERAQLKWVALAASVALVTMLVTQLAGLDSQFVVVPAAVLLYCGIPASVAIAVLKYRLYDIDTVINRTVVYGVVTGGLAGLYLIIVGLSTNVLGDSAQTAAGLVAAALIAIAFAPFRNWVQQATSRRLFGDRHQPAAAVERLGRRIDATARANDLPPAIVDAVASSLRLPYAAIALNGAHVEVSVGSPVGPVAEIPLQCQAVPVATLRVSGRSRHEALSHADRQVLAQLAVHLGVAVRAATLGAEVERSRARLVSAQEDERRRLRRDLHDELGPALTAIGFGIDTADNLIANDKSTADIRALLGRLRIQTDAAIGEIRRVAYALRPPALDELGLAGALTAQAENLSRNGMQVRVSVDGTAEALPAAVESAAFRIGVEAMTNAARHANAQRCDVELRVADIVTLVITDDGTGLPAGFHAGVGLSSMRERVGELGGRIDITTGDGAGCRVQVSLPLDERWTNT